MTRYVALLRGINVGGKSLIRMADLKACLERRGFEDVTTYIASGNVLFTTTESGSARVARDIEKLLAANFDCRPRVTLRTRRQMQQTIRRAPKGFGADPAKYRYDAIFLIEPLTTAAALKGIPLKEGVDEVNAGPGVLYFSRLAAKASQSRINRLVSMPSYQSMTIRNWNTTTTLLRMMEATSA